MKSISLAKAFEKSVDGGAQSLLSGAEAVHQETVLLEEPGQMAAARRGSAYLNVLCLSH